MSKLNFGRVQPIPRGEYDAGTAYKFLDIVSFSGRSFICSDRAGTPIGHALDDTRYWQLLSEKGVVNQADFNELVERFAIKTSPPTTYYTLPLLSNATTYGQVHHTHYYKDSTGLVTVQIRLLFNGTLGYEYPFTYLPYGFRPSLGRVAFFTCFDRDAKKAMEAVIEAGDGRMYMWGSPATGEVIGSGSFYTNDI